ncbi:hypothetical protein DKM44_02105 [Deinococcus irradiatisoli]|uniref:Uncharacterized protein n=1 Tax=Deinococcus irradiatisoli TaxID=2202254 RepID=A0A2Z3JAN5_9DEIO|nr:hypothetical protein [Deinococcus irradiatisoli]AWN22173.1 hypothetical protein DKM44_02105 [Deinococcus irradiatisoli]
MKKALLPLLLLPALLMSCSSGPSPAALFSLEDKTEHMSPHQAGDLSLTIVRAASVSPPPITFSVSKLPAGMTLSFKKNPVTDTPWVEFTVTVGEVPLGTYTATITGRNSSITRTAKVSIVVEMPSRPPKGFP